MGGTGFTIERAFSVSDDRPLPVARLTYTPSDDGPATTVLLTGHDGFVEVDGAAHRLPPDQLDALRVPKGASASTTKGASASDGRRQGRRMLRSWTTSEETR